MALSQYKSWISIRKLIGSFSYAYTCGPINFLILMVMRLCKSLCSRHKSISKFHRRLRWLFRFPVVDNSSCRKRGRWLRKIDKRLIDNRYFEDELFDNPLAIALNCQNDGDTWSHNIQSIRPALYRLTKRERKAAMARQSRWVQGGKKPGRGKPRFVSRLDYNFARFSLVDDGIR